VIQTQPGHVVVVGSINVDHVIKLPHLPAPGETILAQSHRRLPGGKGANQAIAAALAGATVSMIGAVGRDSGGRRGVRELAGTGVGTQGVLRVNGLTGAAFVWVDGAGNNAIAVVAGANEHLDRSAVCEQLDKAMDVGGHVVVLLSLEVPILAVEAAAARAKERGAMVVLNPAPITDLPARLLDVIDVLTPNESEAAALFGGTLDASGRLDWKTVEHDASWSLVITMGDRGAAVFERGATARVVPAPIVEPVDTTGAGDVFNGFLAASLAQSASLMSAVRSAVRAASDSTTRPGARTGPDLLRDQAATQSVP
jgi:ribokinase